MMLVCLYARVSTARQAENDLSIPDQLQQMRDWCKANGHTVVLEYVEPGASATDDKRPMFQKMIAAAHEKPAPFSGIVIHSLSRFFRDSVEFGVYEKKLKRCGVKVVSITQQTSEDAAGEMARRMFSLFDEYQSKENSKHTSRAMRENARQGFFNGSRAPFGYRAISTEISGARGRKKKRLEIDEAEAVIVRKVYDLYLNGHQGRPLGIKEIVKHLMERNQLHRATSWTIHKVHDILSSTTYVGDYFFNVHDSKTGKKRPDSEWVKTTIPALIDLATFERTRALREARSPAKTPPRRLNSPTLLTGLLRCGDCGAFMTQVTGKSGRYRYYKCTTRQGQGNHACQSKNLAMDKLDDLILSHLAERVLAPERLHVLISELRKRVASSRSTQQTTVQALEKQLKDAEARLSRLYEAVESGVVELDETLGKRVQTLKAAKDSTLIELAGARSQQQIPALRILPSNIEAFSKAMRKRLLENGTDFAKRYLQVLVEEIVVRGSEATIRGSYEKLGMAVTGEKKGTSEEVPSFIFDWRARSDSNARPLGS
jgi:site-specific DNA recombinase